jgi:peptidoglycan hydrolase FlgJ
MELQNLISSNLPGAQLQPAAPQPPTLKGNNPTELRKAFDQFVGEAFYGQLLGAMRQTVGKPAYFYGGRAEEIFQGQLDQTMAEQLTEAGVTGFSDPMFELFTLQRN